MLGQLVVMRLVEDVEVVGLVVLAVLEEKMIIELVLIYFMLVVVRVYYNNEAYQPDCFFPADNVFLAGEKEPLSFVTYHIPIVCDARYTNLLMLTFPNTWYLSKI